MSQLVVPGERPLRADARRNREKVLEAARAVFSEQGRDAQMDDVARRAGVGVGTVYRHFPTKEALIEALMVAAFETIAAAAEAALEVEDPWEAFTSVLWRGAETMAGDRALSEVFASIPGATEAVMPTVAGLTETMQRADPPRAGGRRAARGPGRRRHPDGHVRHRQRDEEGAPLPGRLAPPPLDRARRHARHHGERAAARAERARTLGA